MSQEPLARLSRGELEAEGGRPLPAKEVISLLDLNIDLDLALDLAAPIDLAVAANANVAAPIDAAVAANVLSESSTASALADQGVLINQYISGEAIATASQDAALGQADDVPGAALAETDGNAVPDGEANIEAVDDTDIGGTLDGNLLNVDVNVALDADLAAPVAGAVAANANVAAPIDAAVSANIGSVGSEAVAIAQQDAIITQNLDGVVAEATADQQTDIDQ